MTMDQHANRIPAFTKAEYADRLTRTRAEMQRRGLDLLVISDPSNMAWLSGYDGWSFYTHQAVLVALEGDPIWWGRAMDALGAQRTVWMPQDNIVGYDDTYVQNPDKHPFETLAIKSETEIACMRAAARIVENMHQRILEVAEPGLAKNRLVAEIYHSAICGTDDAWGDYPAIVPMTPSGMDATAPHLTWDDKPMRADEATFFEIAGVHRRYHCPQSRTLFFDTVPDTYRRAEEAVLRAIDAGLEHAKPGNRCEDIANAFNHTLNQHGFEKDSRAGYAIGLSYPPDWGERTMSFRRGDTSRLEPGMTFHFMPALWLDDGGLEITESILITETGVECLCNTPRELFVKTTKDAQTAPQTTSLPPTGSRELPSARRRERPSTRKSCCTQTSAGTRQITSTMPKPRP